MPATVTETSLPGVFIVETTVFGDERGFFLETYRLDEFAALGIPDTFVQDNHSRSRAGVLRGIHYQVPPQAKLVRCTAGALLDVAVDLRFGSPEEIAFGDDAEEAAIPVDHRQAAHPPLQHHPDGLQDGVIGLDRHDG